MLFFLGTNADPMTLVVNFIVLALVLGIGMTVHEFAHNYVGHLAGDPMPEKLGRLTLNPMAHINPMGWLMFVIIGFGILGSAPISASRMHRGRWGARWGILFAVAAGPISNLLLAAVTAIIVRVLGGSLDSFPYIVQIFFGYMIFWNVLLFFFNIIPLFPLDGYTIMGAILPPDLATRWYRHQQTSYYVFLGIIFLSIAISYVNLPIPNPLSLLIGQPSFETTRLLVGDSNYWTLVTTMFGL